MSTEQDYPAICPRCNCANTPGGHAAGCLDGQLRWGNIRAPHYGGMFVSDGYGHIREVFQPHACHAREWQSCGVCGRTHVVREHRLEDEAPCNDCGAPCGWCETCGDYRHVDPNAEPCFLIQTKGH